MADFEVPQHGAFEVVGQLLGEALADHPDVQWLGLMSEDGFAIASEGNLEADVEAVAVRSVRLMVQVRGLAEALGQDQAGQVYLEHSDGGICVMDKNPWVLIIVGAPGVPLGLLRYEAREIAESLPKSVALPELESHLGVHPHTRTIETSWSTTSHVEPEADDDSLVAETVEQAPEDSLAGVVDIEGEAQIEWADEPMEFDDLGELDQNDSVFGAPVVAGAVFEPDVALLEEDAESELDIGEDLPEPAAEEPVFEAVADEPVLETEEPVFEAVADEPVLEADQPAESDDIFSFDLEEPSDSVFALLEEAPEPAASPDLALADSGDGGGQEADVAVPSGFSFSLDDDVPAEGETADHDEDVDRFLTGGTSTEGVFLLDDDAGDDRFLQVAPEDDLLLDSESEQAPPEGAEQFASIVDMPAPDSFAMPTPGGFGLDLPAPEGVPQSADLSDLPPPAGDPFSIPPPTMLPTGQAFQLPPPPM